MYSKLQQFCDEYKLFCFDELKNIIEEDLREVDQNFASSFHVECVSDIRNFKKWYPRYYSLIRHGDILTSDEYNYFVYIKGNDFKLLWHFNCIPEEFCGDFHIDYWENINDVNIFSKTDKLPYIDIDPCLDVPRVYQERYKPLRPDLQFYCNHDKFKTIPEDELNVRYFRVKNLIYIFHCYEEKPISLYIHHTISIQAPSRWKILHCLVKLLSLHKRAVVTANHPDRLLERNEFQLEL